MNIGALPRHIFTSRPDNAVRWLSAAAAILIQIAVIYGFLGTWSGKSRLETSDRALDVMTVSISSTSKSKPDAIVEKTKTIIGASRFSQENARANLVRSPPSTMSASPVPTAGVTTTANPPGELPTAVADDYRKLLIERLEQAKHFPADAQYGQYGTVEVVFTLNRTGLVLDVWVKTSSGVVALDKEAVATILRAQPLPPIPSNLPDPSSFTVPLSFDLPN